MHNREGFIYCPFLCHVVTPTTEDSQFGDKKLPDRIVPQKFYTRLDEAIYHDSKFKEAIEDAIAILRQDHFSDFEIALLIQEYCKDKVSKMTLWRYTQALKDKQLEVIEESSIRSRTSDTDGTEESSSSDDYQAQYDEDMQKKKELAEQNSMRVEGDPQKTLDDYLEGLHRQDEINRYFGIDISLLEAKKQVGRWKGISKIKRLYFEI